MCDCKILPLLILTVISSTLTLAESLSGEHVCTRIENHTLSIRESYTEPVIVQTFTWCLQVPPRCKKTRMEDRTRFRVKNTVEKRKISECCEGYVIGDKSNGNDKQHSKCVPFCKSCENGVCVKPNICECEPGYRGDNCTHECPPGSWGKRCIHQCDCALGESCDPVTGICQCPAGRQGPGCNKSCAPGRWGPRCKSTCDCGTEYKTCDPETGRCPTGRTHDLEISLTRDWTEDADLFGTVPRILVSELVTHRFSEVSTTETKTINRVTESTITEIHGDFQAPEITGFDVVGSSRTTELAEDHIPQTVAETSENLHIYEPSESTPQDFTESSSTTTGSDDWNDTEDAFLQPLTKSGIANTPKLPDRIIYSNHDDDLESDANTVGPPHPSYVKTIQKEQVPQIQHDTTVLIVVGSVVSLCLTTLAALVIFYLRSRVFESVPLSIYSGDNKNDVDQDKQNTIRSLKITSTTLPPLPTFVNPVFAANPESALITFDAAELNKHYDNRTGTISIRVSGNIRDLLESHYDRPPTATCRHTIEQNTEHVYDEIPLTAPSLCIRKES